MLKGLKFTFNRTFFLANIGTNVPPSPCLKLGPKRRARSEAGECWGPRSVIAAVHSCARALPWVPPRGGVLIYKRRSTLLSFRARCSWDWEERRDATKS